MIKLKPYLSLFLIPHMNKDYQHTKQFLADQSFHNWVWKSNPSDVLFWENWIQQHPDRSQWVEEAKYIILGIQFNTMDVPNEYINQDWQKITQHINEQQKYIPSLRSRSRLIPVGMMVLIAILIGIVFYTSFDKPSQLVTHRTTYGETRQIELPDQSIVYLNSNSELTYNTPWGKDQPRTVSMKGEAYFDIVKQPSVGGDTFSVRTHDMIITVLGTSFNVNNRVEHSQIALEEGIVLLSHTQPKYVDTLRMSSGELASYSPIEKKFIKQSVRTEIYSSWKDSKWIFEATPIHEIAKKITHQFGSEVIIENKTIANKELSGTISVSNLDLLLKALSSSFDINISRKENTIFIGQTLTED